MVVVGLLAVAAGCGRHLTAPAIECTGSAPDVRADGTWRAQLGGRELSLTIRQQCELVLIYPTWVVGGTWAWSGASSGPVILNGQQMSLKGNVNDLGSFRGLTITIKEVPPYGSVLTGTADGELPLTNSTAGAWQSFSSAPITFARQ